LRVLAEKRQNDPHADKSRQKIAQEEVVPDTEVAGCDGKPADTCDVLVRSPLVLFPSN
jgi:hypothetical protein